MPIVNMQKVRMEPPVMTLVRRDTESVKRTAGMLIASMRMAERPEARKEDVFAEMPAWAKRVGAYCG